MASSIDFGAPSDIQTWNGETLITDPGCFSTQETATNSYIKVDFGVSKQVYTVFIVTAGNADGSGFDVMNKSALYVGINGSSPTANDICLGNYSEIGETGFYDCNASGRYLFLRTSAASKI